MDSVLSWLQSAGLEKFYPRFKALGVTEDTFIDLGLADFTELGITEHTDRVKLHKLKQAIIREMDSDFPIERPSRQQQRRKPSPRPTRAAKSEDSPRETASITRGSKIRVVVRKRPLNRKEDRNGEHDIVTAIPERSCIQMAEPKEKVDLTKYTMMHKFVFDEVFDETSANEQIYMKCCQPLISSIFQKAKATCFAYGQTGSGKTFTMMGSDPGARSGPNQGIYGMAVRDLFKYRDREFPKLTVHVSFFEIYGGKLFDLLNERQKLCAREDARQRCNIVGLQEVQCDDISSLFRLVELGNTVRSTGQTGANIDSSRSHAVLQISLHDAKKLHGKFSFIDLAGSERGADTINSDRRTRLEGAEINRSLLALKECIRALDQEASHLPFRGSKLTQVLKDSFIGNSRTVMIANISPNNLSCEHSLNTLRYANRVKELKKGNSKSSKHDAYMPHRDKAGVVVGSKKPLSKPKKVVEISNKRPEFILPEVKAEPEPEEIESEDDDFCDYDDDDEDNEEAARKNQLMMTHANVARQIMEEEDDLLDAHRAEIDETMKLVKEEMELLRGFDKYELSIDEYHDKLAVLLERKIKVQSDLRKWLADFKAHLQEEESLSKSMTKPVKSH